MSKTPIPTSVKAELWWRSAGRCEFRGCNKPLDKHGITFDNCNLANCAHIIADSEDGPRGDKTRSRELAKDASNIMLMCPECHKYIDHEGKDKYDADTLFAMKKHHEDRMRFLTGLPEDTQARIVTYGTKIGDQKPDFSFEQLLKAILPDFYPNENGIIDLGGDWYTGSDWNEYWSNEVKNLEYNCDSKILRHQDRETVNRIALFGFAPMPLLVKLGTILNNKHEVEVYQKQRSGGWAWPSTEAQIDYIINRPTDTSKRPILVLSLSFDITERIKENNKDSSIWELTIATPNPDFLQSRKMLYDFGRKVELLLDEIAKDAQGQPINLFLAVPVACAIEFGRVWMQKANSPINIYDFNRHHGNIDMLAITLNN